MTVHEARCADCAWSFRDDDLLAVSDEAERHARKELHEVDLERAVATDGGHDQDAAAYITEDVELRIRGKRVHVQTLLAVLSTSARQLQSAGLGPAAALAMSVADEAMSVEQVKGGFESMVLSGGDGWEHDRPGEALDVELVSIATDGGATHTSSGAGRAVCPNCGREPYRGTHNGANCYKCRSVRSTCEWRGSPLARTKDELRRVNAELRHSRSPETDQPGADPERSTGTEGGEKT